MPKTERLELRLSPEHKSLVESAAALSGLSLSAFVVSEVLDRAYQITADHNRTTLSRRDWDRFLEIMDEPAEPTPALRRAAQRYLRSKDAGSGTGAAGTGGAGSGD
ncbi:MAG: type II toxin-antitoxin system TacA family antitoxin [Planctomycetota bacterium]|jgi:uncharacterized protein (DUF1778 family)